MNRIIIGNLISLLASVLMVFIGLIKSKRKILVGQCLQFALYAVGNTVLGGFTGAVSNIVSMVRNLFCIKRDLKLIEKIVFSAILVVLSLVVNKSGLLGWLPIAAAVIYTFALSLRDEAKLKAVMIFTQLMWLVYDWTIHGYVNFTFDLITIVSTSIGIARVIKGRKEISSSKSE